MSGAVTGGAVGDAGARREEEAAAGPAGSSVAFGSTGSPHTGHARGAAPPPLCGSAPPQLLQLMPVDPLITSVTPTSVIARSLPVADGPRCEYVGSSGRGFSPCPRPCRSGLLAKTRPSPYSEHRSISPESFFPA
jgi:hypothetical protein